MSRERLFKECQGCGNSLPATAIFAYCERCSERKAKESRERQKEYQRKITEASKTLGVPKEDIESWHAEKTARFWFPLLFPILVFMTWPFGTIAAIDEFFRVAGKPEWSENFQIFGLWALTYANFFAGKLGLYGNTDYFVCSHQSDKRADRVWKNILFFYVTFLVLRWWNS